MIATGGAGSSELRLRTLSALALATLAIASAWFGGWLLLAVWLAASIAVLYEWMVMTRVAPHPTLFLLGAAGLSATLVLFALSGWVPALAALAATVLLTLIVARDTAGRLWAGGGLLYAAPIACAPALLRFDRPDGLGPLLWMFAVVWTTDVAAYAAGRTFGGPKLMPRVSPKKTWSGLLGGLVGAIVAGSLVAFLFSRKAQYDLADAATVIVLSGLASLVSQAGDLAESAMKRRFGAKDSGTLIPGHGGFLDRLDGFAVVALCVVILVPLASVLLWSTAP